MIKVCVAGATGRMGSTIIQEAVDRDFKVVGAVAAPEDPGQGKTLSELGLCDSQVKVVDPSQLEEAVHEAQVYISFTAPQAEMKNLPVVAETGTKIVMGTTGFTQDQMIHLRGVVSSRVPAVFAPNFAIGINLLFRILKNLESLPPDYDISVIEAHHSKKRDAPSGTAKALADTISEIRGYQSQVHCRNGLGPRKPGEMEVVSVRAGGIPGVHTIIAAGPYEIIEIKHTSFSRRVFAQGALYVAQWIVKQSQPGVYSLDEILNS
ncbi:MAG: 4-hydroxy-tetrahydrodipicolinate reductase [Thermoproteota archaeon]